MIKIITDNWGLKLLALMLALIVYHSLKTSSPKTDNEYERNIIDSRGA